MGKKKKNHLFRIQDSKKNKKNMWDWCRQGSVLGGTYWSTAVWLLPQ